jgi:glycosyltransferase involved in cell wall biosynthesis
MRILYLSSSPFLTTHHTAGWGTHMREAVRAMEARGHTVRVITGEGPASTALTTAAPRALRRAVPGPVRHLRREWLELRHDRDLTARAREAAIKFRPDIIYERTALLHLTGSRLARTLGVPLVLEQNSPQVEERIAQAGMALAPLATAMERRAYRAAEAVVTVSTALKEYVVGMGADREHTHVVPNGARPELFDPAQRDGLAVRRQHDLPERAVVAGFVGAFADWHGLDRLVKAFALAQTGVQADFHLMLVGDGPHRPDLERLASDLGIRPWVLFTGAVPYEQVPDHVAAMDIAVMPSSNWYGSPIKIFEYGAMGRAVIGPDTPPVQEVMRDEEEGLIIPAGSVDALAAALSRLAGHALLRQRLGARFRERVLRQYTWNHAGDRLLSVCEDACRQKSRRIGIRVAEAAVPEPTGGIRPAGSGSGGPADLKAGR